MRLLGLILIVLFSCSVEEQEAIPMKDILPEGAGRVMEDTVETEIDEIPKISVQAFGDLSSLIGACYSDSLLEGEPTSSRQYLDRFDHQSKTEVKIDSSKTIIKYDYRDSISASTSFYHLLDCLGSKCEAVQLHEEKRISGLKNHVVLLFPKQILIMSQVNIDRRNLEDYLLEEELTFTQALMIDNRGVTRWIMPAPKEEEGR